ncbi:hypothetical protein H6771_00620 [Candidatus Peribacteria bacterium]|nr:hypothetical protein [Candidatus Peribacteria bacterium]
MPVLPVASLPPESAPLRPVRRQSGLLLLGQIVLLMGLIALGVYTFLLGQQRREAEARVSALQDSVRNTQAATLNLREGEKMNAEITAAFILEKLEMDRIRWSEVVSTVLSQQSDAIFFINFTSDSSQRITASGVGADLNAVAEFLEKLSKFQENTADPFISVVSTVQAASTTRRTGASPVAAVEGGVQFQLQFDYTPSPLLPSSPRLSSPRS